MKAFVVLVILVAGAWFTWSYFSGEDDDGSGAAESGPQLPGGGDAGEAGPAGTGGELPAEAQAALERADARWDAITAAGDEPAEADDAVAIARDYSHALHAAYNDPGLAALRRRLVRERLTPLADTIFFSTMPFDDELVGTYQAKSGDSLDDIGREFGLSAEYLNLLRGGDRDIDDVRLGETMKVIRVTTRDHPADDWTEGYHYHVDKSEFILDLYIEGVFVRRFPVGIGAEESPTPVGTSFIEMRERTPGQWTAPDGTLYYRGEPGFIIGDYWIRINPQLGASGIGFHTYTGEGPVTGAKVSNGCIRLEADDMELLFALTVKTANVGQPGFITRAPMSVEITE